MKKVDYTIPYPMKDYINDPEIKDNLSDLSLRKTSFNTPSPEAEIKWSEEEIQALNLFFQKCRS